jgi:hypothetical protein
MVVSERRTIMEDLARRFRRGAEHREGLRYAEDLRQLAVEYAMMASARGESRREIAGTLGLSEATLHRWQQRTTTVGSITQNALREVVLVEQGLPGGPVLVMPSGARVEGLSVGDLVAVLEALG